jgi:hypothetical protein
MTTFNKMDMLPVSEVLGASQKDDKNKADVFCKMGEIQFLAQDVRPHKVKDKDKDEGGEIQTELHAQISVPLRGLVGVGSIAKKNLEEGKRLRLNFSMPSFKQFSRTQLGIPAEYLMKCPAALAKENVNFWKAAMAGKDLLIRIRAGGTTKAPYARAVLPASYGTLDNTPFLGMINRIAKEADMRVWRYDMPDTSLHVKCVLPEHMNMGTSKNRDDVHIGFHAANSETGVRSISVDVMTFRLVCVNGMIALVDGNRLVSQRHVGEIDFLKLEQAMREGIHKTCATKDSVLGRMKGLRDQKPSDVFEEARAVWSRFNLPAAHRNMTLGLLQEEYTGGTRWDLINAITQTAREVVDNPDVRMRLEEGAGKYMDMEKAIL